MTDLPIELWHLIFDHLQLVDLSSCAQVCKTIYLAVKAYRIREIAFTPGIDLWFHHVSDNYKHRVYFRNASILRRSSFCFDHLKRLKIGRLSPIYNLNEINQFSRLEKLDIDLKFYENEKSMILSLVNLKVLYLFMSDHLPYLELDTPRLTEIYTFSLKKLEFIYPESVRCIHTFFHDGKLSMFRNLEYLIFTDCYSLLDSHPSYPGGFDEISVTVLKKLKEIDFYYHINYSLYGGQNLNVFKRMVANLLALGRPDLKVFWQNVQITAANWPTDYEHPVGNRSQIGLQLWNYEKLKKKISIPCFDFNERILEIRGAGFNPRSEEFISKFFAKFSLRKIVVHVPIEQNEGGLLLEFIARSPDLFALEFGNSCLGQLFFDRMADTVRLNAIPLRHLQITGSSDRVQNFEFLLGLRDLERFKVYQQLPAELITKLFKLPMLAEIEFGRCIFELPFSPEFRIERISMGRIRLNEKPLSLPLSDRQLLGLARTTVASDLRPSKKQRRF